MAVRKYFNYNGHGDVVQLAGTDGNVTKSYDYDAFGVEKSPDAADTNVFRYSGEYFDKETGTIYLRARYYSPGIGRFISEDSVWGKDADPLSLNLYTYCSNNPIMLVDPSGHMSFWQTDDLLGGIKDGGLDMVKGIIDSPMALYNIGKEFIFGDLTLEDIASVGIDSITSDYKYLYNNKGVLSPFSDVSNEDVRAYGSHMTSVMADIAAVFTAGGTAAAKLSEVLSKSKSGQIILESACFTEDTLISTSDGMKSIEDINIGDEVYSENPETGEKGLKKVVKTFIHNKDTLLYVYVGNTKIETTEEHPFWVEGKGWVLAGELKEGDILRLKSNENIKVTKLECIELKESVKVYNFEVEDWHTYFVSDINVLVHNKAMKGKEFRGGSKKSRDNWYGYDNRDFQKWWERKGKKEWGGNDIEDSKMAKDVYESWVESGKPKAD